MFERLLDNNMFTFLFRKQPNVAKRTLIYTSWFINKQVSFNCKRIFSAFDVGDKVRGIFTNLPKAFDRVWYKGFFFKLKQNGISGELIALTKKSLSFRKQKVVLNSHYLSWADIKAGGYQGPIPGPVPF